MISIRVKKERARIIKALEERAEMFVKKGGVHFREGIALSEFAEMMRQGLV